MRVWRHNKTGRLYVITGHCMIESTATIAVRYQALNHDESPEWVRPELEFHDGRFTPVRVIVDPNPEFPVSKFERLPDLNGYGLWRRREPYGGFSYWSDDIGSGRRIFDEGIDDWKMLGELAERLGVDLKSKGEK